MAKLPVISGAEAVRRFERAGWRADRQKGSHVVLLKQGHIASLSVPPAQGTCAGDAPCPYPRGGDDG
jgi:predicted RNA binding protein YcfA (HicA-like mRNA interferase family)